MSRTFVKAPSSRPMALQIGQSVEGVLSGIAPEGDFSTNVIFLVDDTGVESRVWSTAWLDNLISEDYVGLYIKITRTADVPSTKKGYSATKTFVMEVDSKDLEVMSEIIAKSQPADEQSSDSPF